VSGLLMRRGWPLALMLCADNFSEQGKEYLYASVDGKEHWSVRLAEQEGLRKLLSTRPDLTPFMAITGIKGDNLPCMTDSLRLIIADMITLGKQQLAGWAERNAADVALLTLAGQGLASIRKDQAGNWIWCASSQLIDSYQMGGGTPNRNSYWTKHSRTSLR
jgi:hypothetical protein